MDNSGRTTGDSDREKGKRQGHQSASVNTSGLAGMGVEFVVAILLCLFVGKWLDSRLGTTPWLLILGVFGGAGASMYAMYRKVFPADKQNGAKPPAAPKSPSP
jgi:F0F1-type ATP synthase assembly protein I